MPSPYVMTISRTTVDKLGIKMYDKASAVVSELIANSYDADAEKVTVNIPLNRYLATRSRDEIVDAGLEIVIEDDGHGMTPDVINSFYLKIGVNPRTDPLRGETSLEKGRPRMGRKGIGKLAPFGICKIIEVISAGGTRTQRGYHRAHFILDYDQIHQETDADYLPTIGRLNDTYARKRGTKIILRNFLYRRAPDIATFHRQLSRRFGFELPDFRIEVVDTESGEEFVVGTLPIEIDEVTRINVDDRPVVLDDRTQLPVRGWVAYAKNPYSNVEIAGVRIYARGRYVSHTRDFGLNAGFTGEYTIRSYLVGTIHADWLDLGDGEDLILSGRQDILWSSEIGESFQAWGQNLLRELGRTSWSPVQQRTADIFLETLDIEEEARSRYGDEAIVESAVRFGKMIGRSASRAALTESPEYAEGLKELVLTMAPHKMIVEKLKEAEETIGDDPLELVAKIFNEARIAEAASLGMIAIQRVQAIDKLEEALSPEAATNELTLQKLLESAVWLINPQWTVLQANQTFDTMRQAFERWYRTTYGHEVHTSALTFEGEERRRPDFIMLHIGRRLEIVEIKKPQHDLIDEEFDRLLGYFNSIQRFLDDNERFKEQFPEPHMTLICDGINLSPTTSEAYQRQFDQNRLERKTWEELLADSKTVHSDFIRARSRR